MPTDQVPEHTETQRTMHKRSVTSSPARRPPSDGRSSADAKRFGRPTTAHNGNRVVDLLAMFEHNQ